MSTLNMRSLEMPRYGAVEIGGFSFDWIPFLDLGELFRRRNNLDRFNCLNNRYGVYCFFDTSGNVPYVGAIENRPLKDRIRQYFTFSHDALGNTFATRWMERSNSSYRDFKPYIERHRLGTLSIVRTDLTNEQKAVISDMENALICMFKPAYNVHRYRVTDDEYCRLASLYLLPSSSSPENSPG